MGIATGLLNYAFALAKNLGGMKVVLTADYPSSDASKLYVKLGFRTIVDDSAIFAAGSPKAPFENHNGRSGMGCDKEKGLIF